MVDDRECLAAVERQDQIVAIARQVDIANGNVRIELDGIWLFACDDTDVGVDRVVAVTMTVDVGVTPAIALQKVIAGSAVENVGGIKADDGVVARGLLLRHDDGAEIVGPPYGAVGK